MQIKIKKYVIIASVIAFLQLCAGLFGFFIYYYQLFNFKYLLETEMIGAMAFVVFDFIFIWIILHRVLKARSKNDITAAEIIGEDIQEAYSFGNIGIIIVDNENVIFWMNDYFNEMQSRLIDSNIFEVIPELESLKTAESGNKVNVHMDRRIYSVEYLREANVFIFKDITDYEAMNDHLINYAPVMGVISIDDYKDIIAALDENKSYDLTASIQKLLIEYGKNFNIVLRRMRSDLYTFICNKGDYDRLFADNFSILDKVKQIGAEENFKISISIGIGYGSEDYAKINEMAFSALDVCLSRGGDQAVIQPYGDKLIFIGGKSEVTTKRSNVKLKVLSSSLHTIINKSSTVYVMGHNVLDMDALGACLAIYAFGKINGKDVKIIYNDKKIESKTKLAFKEVYSRDRIKEMTISSKDAIEEMDNESLLIMVDVHRPGGTIAPEVVEKISKVAVIDHHRRGEEFVEDPIFSYIEPSASSTCEMLTELIKLSDQRIEITPEIATFMLSGILLDTNHYRNKTNERTYEASSTLKQLGADNVKADSFLKEDWSESQLKTKIMATAVHEYTGVVVCKYLDNEPIDRAMVSIVAQEMLEIKGVNACFVIGKTDSKEMSISSRSDGTINVQYLMEKLGGGGHFTASAVQLHNVSVNDAYVKLKEVLNLFLQEARVEAK